VGEVTALPPPTVSRRSIFTVFRAVAFASRSPHFSIAIAESPPILEVRT
jgi:hypothetical protein